MRFTPLFLSTGLLPSPYHQCSSRHHRHHRSTNYRTDQESQYLFPISTATTTSHPLHTRSNIKTASLTLFVNEPRISGTTTHTSTTIESMVRSVNYHLSRKCNYACKFCFHTAKTSSHLSIEKAKEGMRLLQQAGAQKINFAGGEPFLYPDFLGELCRETSQELGLACSIISNGSLITKQWMEQYGKYVNVLGISVDSFDYATNLAIGRRVDITYKNDPDKHLSHLMEIREWCEKYNVMFKLNTVVCKLNWREDMNDIVYGKLCPKRWKVFQVLVLGEENAGLPGNLRNAQPLVVSDNQFWSFVHRHEQADNSEDRILIPEPNHVMQNSYLLLDEEMRFLDCSTGAKVPASDSILDVGVETALQQCRREMFDATLFHHRGGIYDWNNKYSAKSPRFDDAPHLDEQRQDE